MAGSSPIITQQLLDRSLRQRNPKSSKICAGKDRRNCYENDRERAFSLYVACKHLPQACLSSPGERTGMLQEAAKTLEFLNRERTKWNRLRNPESARRTGRTNHLEKVEKDKKAEIEG
jgi:hypothetical protein